MQLTRKRFFEVISRAATGSAALTAFGALARADAANEAGAAAPPVPVSSKKKTGTDIKGTTEAVVAFVAGSNSRRVPSEALELHPLWASASKPFRGPHRRGDHPLSDACLQQRSGCRLTGYRSAFFLSLSLKCSRLKGLKNIQGKEIEYQ